METGLSGTTKSSYQLWIWDLDITATLAIDLDLIDLTDKMVGSSLILMSTPSTIISFTARIHSLLLQLAMKVWLLKCISDYRLTNLHIQERSTTSCLLLGTWVVFKASSSRSADGLSGVTPHSIRSSQLFLLYTFSNLQTSQFSKSQSKTTPKPLKSRKSSFLWILVFSFTFWPHPSRASYPAARPQSTKST